MSASLVVGNSVNLYTDLGDGYAPVMCGKVATINQETETAERTTVDSGIFKQYKALAISGSMTLEGDVFYDERYTVVELMEWQKTLAVIPCSFETESDSGTSVIWTFNAVIQSVNYSGSVNAPASFSVNLLVDGEIVKA